ncbi:formin-like protein [Gracilaria domingensis]|nr:formin-like protein [Gracilaria domingensis]
MKVLPVRVLQRERGDLRPRRHDVARSGVDDALVQRGGGRDAHGLRHGGGRRAARRGGSVCVEHGRIEAVEQALVLLLQVGDAVPLGAEAVLQGADARGEPLQGARSGLGVLVRIGLDGGQAGGLLALEHLCVHLGGIGGLAVVVQANGVLLGGREAAPVGGGGGVGVGGVAGVAERLVLLAGPGGGEKALLLDVRVADFVRDFAALAVGGDELERVVGGEGELGGGALGGAGHGWWGLVGRRVVGVGGVGRGWGRWGGVEKTTGDAGSAKI